MSTLRVTLAGTKPVVWRRIEVPLACTVADLAQVLRTVFDRSGAKQHSFEANGRCYAPVADDAIGGRPGEMITLDLPGGPVTLTMGNLGSRPFGGSLDEAAVLVAEMAGRPGSTLTYTYGHEEHRLVVEQVTSADPEVSWPRCLDGRGVAPDEDTGEARLGAPDLAALSAALRRDLQTPSGDDSELDLDLVGVLPELADDAPCECGCEDGVDARPVLPAAPEPDVAALADEAGRSVLVRRAVALAQWVGTGRAVTPAGVLRPADAVAAIAALGLDGPDAADGPAAAPADQAGQGSLELGLVEPVRPRGRSGLRSAKDHAGLHPLWSAAVGAGLVDVAGGTARAGSGLASWTGPAADEDRLTSWVRLLAGYLSSVEEAARVTRSATPQLSAGLLTRSVPLLYVSTRTAAPSAAIWLALAAAEGVLTDDASEEFEPEDEFEDFVTWLSQARTLCQHWLLTGVLVPADAVSAGHPGAQAVAELLETLRTSMATAGAPEAKVAAALATALTTPAPVVQLGSLGVYALARLLRAHGVPLRTPGECVDVHPTELLDRLCVYTEQEAADEARRWVEARGPHWERDVRTAGWAASTPDPEGPVRRLALTALVAGCGSRVEPLLTTWSGDPWLAVPVAWARAATGTGPELRWEQLGWLEVDQLWPDLPDPDDFEDALAESSLPMLLRRPDAAEGLSRLRHPHAAAVLRGVTFVLADPEISALIEASTRAPRGRAGRGARPVRGGAKRPR